MSRPAHFADQHTLARQTWLRDLQDESNLESMHAMQMLVSCVGWSLMAIFAIAVGALFADWMTGEFYAAELVATWRAS